MGTNTCCARSPPPMATGPSRPPLTRYYVEAGTPPGQWLGSGVASGKGQLAVGDRVSEAELQLLMGMGRDPITGDPLGLAFPAYKSVSDRSRPGSPTWTRR